MSTKINAYLTFKGTCAEAFKFYEKVLRGKLAFIMTHGESPMADKIPPAMKNLVIHARLECGDQVLMGSDGMPDRPEEKTGFSVSLMIDTAAEAERVFTALSEKGQVRMALQQTFWAFRFGMLVDQYGTPWMINCEKEA